MRIWIPFFFASIFFPLLSSADLVVNLQTNGNEDGKMYIRGKDLKMQRSGQNQETIFLGSKQLLFSIDSASKQYTEISKEDMKAISAKMDAAMSQLDAKMASMPPEQQAMMKQMMGGMMKKMMPQETAPAEITKTNETETISGYPCVKYIVKRGSEVTREYWVADPSVLSGGSELRTALDSMGSFLKELIGSLSKGPMAGMMENPFSEFSAVEGVPIKTILYKDGKRHSETIITSIANEGLEPDVFQIPDGYSKKKVSEGLR